MVRLDERPDERIDQLVYLIICINLNAFDTSQPDKVVKHLAAQAFPKLTARDIETAFNASRARGRGRPSKKKFAELN
jgi:hypothetical protein